MPRAPGSWHPVFSRVPRRAGDRWCPGVAVSSVRGGFRRSGRVFHAPNGRSRPELRTSRRGPLRRRRCRRVRGRRTSRRTRARPRVAAEPGVAAARVRLEPSRGVACRAPDQAGGVRLAEAPFRRSSAITPERGARRLRTRRRRMRRPPHATGTRRPPHARLVHAQRGTLRLLARRLRRAAVRAASAKPASCAGSRAGLRINEAGSAARGRVRGSGSTWRDWPRRVAREHRGDEISGARHAPAQTSTVSPGLRSTNEPPFCSTAQVRRASPICFPATDSVMSWVAKTRSGLTART